MKTDEKTDIERKVISTELLNENTLLVISKADEEEFPRVSIKYEKYNEVRSKDLVTLTPDVKVEHNDQMIAIFCKEGKVLKKYKLASVYDIRIHEYVGTSNMHLHYEASKYQGAKVKRLVSDKK